MVLMDYTEQTALLGSVGEEFNTLPVENEEFRAISEKKALEALKPKRETIFIDKVPGKLLQPRNALPGEKSAFVVSIQSIFSSLSLIMLIANLHSKQQNQSRARRKKTKPPVCHKTNCWILFTSVSANTNIGHLKHSRRDSGNQRHILSRLWRWWRIWSSLAILL